MTSRSRGKRPPSGCRVRHCAGSTLRHAVRCAQCRTGLPRDARRCLVVPAQRQAAGVPSAGSQPFQFTTYATPPMGRRRAAEGGPEGRCRENREQRQRQRAGAATGAGGSVRASGRCRPGSEGKKPSLGVPGSALCRIDPPARGALRTMPYRAPPGRAPRPGCSGSEGGRRRPIGGVAALPIPHLRDPADGATPGRRRRTGRPAP